MATTATDSSFPGKTIIHYHRFSRWSVKALHLYKQIFVVSLIHIWIRQQWKVWNARYENELRVLGNERWLKCNNFLPSFILIIPNCSIFLRIPTSARRLEQRCRDICQQFMKISRFYAQFSFYGREAGFRAFASHLKCNGFFALTSRVLTDSLTIFTSAEFERIWCPRCIK